MKFFKEEDRIQVVDGETNVLEIINELTADGISNQEEPFYIFDIGDVVKKHQVWIEKMPRIIPHYAVKCNDNEVVLASLAALGCSFDCASKAEITKILNLGVNPDRIIFANPMKPKNHIRYAQITGVKQMTFDCETELHKIKAIYPNAE
jgi:ornithine decarboxylase